LIRGHATENSVEPSIRETARESLANGIARRTASDNAHTPAIPGLSLHRRAEPD